MKTAALVRWLEPLELTGLNMLVHVSLPALHFGDADAPAVCEALLHSVGPHGTILMPAFTCTETLANPHGLPVPFHSDLPVSGEVGAVAEAFRKMPGVLRSNHPSHSFSAYGRQASLMLSTQRDNNPLGPIKKLNVMRGYALLLGAPLRACTAIHLAEETAAVGYLGRSTAIRINAGGYQERVVLEHVPGCSATFDRLDARLDPGHVTSAPLPGGVARKIPIRYLVQQAAAALAEDPAFFVCDDITCTSCAHKREAIRGRRGAGVVTSR